MSKSITRLEKGMLDRENLLANVGMQIRFRLMTVVLTRDQCNGRYNQFCVLFWAIIRS